MKEAQHPGSVRSRRPGVKLSRACRASSSPQNATEARFFDSVSERAHAHDTQSTHASARTEPEVRTFFCQNRNQNSNMIFHFVVCVERKKLPVHKMAALCERFDCGCYGLRLVPQARSPAGIKKDRPRRFATLPHSHNAGSSPSLCQPVFLTRPHNYELQSVALAATRCRIVSLFPFSSRGCGEQQPPALFLSKYAFQ